MFNFIKEVMAPTTRSSTNANVVENQDNTELLKESPGKANDAADIKPIKGYKITDNERTRKFGIGANCLQMLKTKAKLKFPVSKRKKIKEKSLVEMFLFGIQHFVFKSWFGVTLRIWLQIMVTAAWQCCICVSTSNNNNNNPTTLHIFVSHTTSFGIINPLLSLSLSLSLLKSPSHSHITHHRPQHHY